MKRRTSIGSSLVEVLVVIVIFLVGILAVTQVFPRGLGIMKTSRNITVASQVARAELERLKGNSEQVAEAIVANNDQPGQSGLFADVDAKALPNDWLPSGTRLIRQDGTIESDYGVGDWPLYTGANRFRGIIGEGRTVPAPKFVQVMDENSNLVTMYASMITVQFGPVRPSSNANRPTFQVYGNDMRKRPSEGPPQRFEDYVYYVDQEANRLYLPNSVPQAPARSRFYRIAYTYYTDIGAGQFQSRSLVQQVEVPGNVSGRRGYSAWQFTPNTQGDAIAWVDYDSIRVQRAFENRTTRAFTDVNTRPDLRDDAAYEMKVVDPTLGVLIFNPAGFEYQERRGRGRVPLTAKIDYNVLDWRIMRDDFRVPDGSRTSDFQVVLSLQNLKPRNSVEADGRRYQGVIPPDIVSLPTRGSNTGPNPDVVIVDRETGGIIDPAPVGGIRSYVVDNSRGLITFYDTDNNLGNGLTLRIIYPGDTRAQDTPDARGRSMRAMYQVRGDWAVQPVKAVSQYRVAYSPSITYDQCYPGLINGSDGDPGEVYFPLADVGKTVVIGEVRYVDNNGLSKSIYDQEFIIREPRASGGMRLGRVILTDKIDPSLAPRLDHAKGAAVRRVKGVSMSVRVFWNPTAFTLKADGNENLKELNKWLINLRRTESETFLVKGEGIE